MIWQNKMVLQILALVGIFPLALSEGVDPVYTNHRYFDTSRGQQTPHSFQRPVLNHLQHRAPTLALNRRPPPVWAKNSSNSQPPRLAMAKRSGDYHYMDYPQYDVDDHGPVYHRVPAVRTIPYHPRPYHHPWYEKPSKSLDITTIGIIAILKLILLKIVSFGVFKIIIIFLIKIFIIKIILGFKFLIILKLIKLVKLLTIPIIIPFILLLIFPLLLLAFFFLLPLLLPLLLAPLLPLFFISILLPLLLSIPVPVLAPNGRRKRQTEDLQARSVEDDVLYLVRRVLESEQCIERVACQLASNKQSKSYAVFVAWYLEKAAQYVRKPRFMSYKEAYKRGMMPGTTSPQCKRLYACNNPRKAL